MKINRNLFLWIGLVMLNLHTRAQSYQAKGHVYDAQTQQALAAVLITSVEGDTLGSSDAKGYFEIQPSGYGSSIQLQLPGYLPLTVDLNPGLPEFNIQMEADGTSLSEVRVSGYSMNRTLKETAGGVSFFTDRDIQRGSGLSLQGALNSIPGVQMDQSTLSEARISIRGNGIRSAFGIRNIKIYVNEIPVTEADGTTRIEALDVNSIGRAEIIKGPASSLYGAGTGGAINFHLKRSPYQERSIETSGLAGAYGLRRLASTFRDGGDKLNTYLSYGWQEYGGYREHSRDMRRFLTGNFQLLPDDNRIITVLLNRTTQYSQIPGALTQAQVGQDPTMASPGNLDKAAGRYQNWTRVGLGQQYHFNDRFSNSSSVFTYFYDLNHPLPFAYIRNTYQSYGGRTRFNYDPGFQYLSTRFTWGAEFNEGLTKGTQYVNDHGNEGAINGNVDYRNTFYSLFFQSETVLAPNTTLSLGLSYNKLSYDVENYLNQSQRGKKDFDPQGAPRVALSHHFSEALTLHASISSGFSPPSSSEIKNVDGSINPLLQAERGTNYELNAKGKIWRSRLNFDLAVFKMDLKGELIAQSVQQGITIYNNAGKTAHNGAELALSYQVFKPEDNCGFLNLRTFAALTYADFSFREYKILDEQSNVKASYNGNALTGIAPWVLNLGLDLEMRSGLYLFANYFYNDRLPLNDANTAYNGAYRLLNSKIGYRHSLSRNFQLDACAGMDNLLNEDYSSIVSLNAVAYGSAQPAYFNPSPRRNGYGGLSLKYIF